jgi:integrase
MTQNYGWSLRYVPAEVLAKADFGHLSRVPWLFDSKLAYAELPNQFLIDLALGVWDQRHRGSQKRTNPPSDLTLRTTAEGLSNALEWAEARSIDLLSCEYSQVLIARYQSEMYAGQWSAHGRPLKPSTINARVGTALAYQLWAADKGLRPPVVVPTVTITYRAPSHSNSRSHQTKTVEARTGKLRVLPSSLSFPREEQIEAWRKGIHLKPQLGATEGLLVDLILETAIRREEASCWRIDTLPLNRADWKILNRDQPPEHQNVEITLRYGTKGTNYGTDHGDKIGPEGKIKLPLLLADRIDDYRQRIRPKALAVAVRSGKTVTQQQRMRENAVHLFLHPGTGKRYSGKQIYKAWTSVQHPAHWNPHAGRHYWACRYLERRMQDHAELMAKILGIVGLTHDSPLLLALSDTAITVIRMEIQPQLRHVSSRTTESYLQWYFLRNRLPYQPRMAWDGDDEDEDAYGEG